MAYRRLQEHVGRFREFLRQNADTPEEQELLAAKLMGRWRSGAPLVLSPNKDDPALAADSPQGGRRPFPIAVMLRIYCLQQWYNLSDPGAEDALRYPVDARVLQSGTRTRSDPG